MGDEDYETIYALTMEDPENIGMLVASTPTGKRGTFYRLCKELNFSLDDIVQPVNTKEYGYVYDNRKYDKEKANGWKEFHFPSMVNPKWNAKMEMELKQEYNEIGYQHEVLAEFGTETEGVFNKAYIDEAASVLYPFEEKRTKDGPIAIGIDWDKHGATTNIVVVQYDPNDIRRSRPEIGLIDNGFGRFKIINHIEIPKSDMQYDIAVRTVIDLDRRYNPFAIRPDRGAGEYQIEMLRKELGEKVKGVFYGEKKEVRDPITNVIEKKSLKPLLINQLVLLTERGQIRIPNKEISEVIHRQMINYRVVKVSSVSKEPIYTDTDEHALDAFVFALTGFMDEYPQLLDFIHQVEIVGDMNVVTPNRYNVMNKVENQLINGLDLDNNKDEEQEEIRYNRVPLGYSRKGSSTGFTNLGWKNNNTNNSIWRNKF
ncbi:hypothetical protein E4P35_12110 [Thiopseudomonas sp. 4R-3cl]|nr:hypothetical protein E4P35_12110 [Thiopseudomonas sp. 4R-3cl]